METVKELSSFPEAGCDCCVVSLDHEDQDGHIFSCTERRTILTHREERVLIAIRENSLRARELRGLIKELHGNGSSDSKACRIAVEELETLRETRLVLEHERVEAAEERMRFLGHA